MFEWSLLSQREDVASYNPWRSGNIGMLSVRLLHTIRQVEHLNALRDAVSGSHSARPVACVQSANGTANYKV